MADTTDKFILPEDIEKTEEENKGKINFSRIHSHGANNFFRTVDFANMTRVQLENALRTLRTPTSYTNYTKEDILKFLKNPEGYNKQLRRASIYLYYSNVHYWRLIKYFAGLSPLLYWISPVKAQINRDKIEVDKIRASYKKASDYISTMNFRAEMEKVKTTVFREDAFYGYMYILKDSFYLRKLDGEYCKITSCEDGCFIFSFDFSYFNGHKEELNYYGEDFIVRYNNYQKDSSLRWQELPYENEFCVKLQDEILYSVPPFVGTFDDLYDIKCYKELQKAKTQVQNYKILGLTLPVDENGSVTASEEEIVDYYTSLTNVLPENIAAFTTPYKTEEYSFERAGASDTDLTDEATNNFMNSAGVSNLLFNSKVATANSLPYSIESDATIVYGLHRQIERNVNRLLKKLPGAQKFAINIIDCTYFNIKEKLEELLKLGQYGFPVRSQIAAMVGIMDNSLSSMCYLENEVLGLDESLIPLKSSTNSSAEVLEGTKGRPTKDNPSDKTIANQKTL